MRVVAEFETCHPDPERSRRGGICSSPQNADLLTMDRGTILRVWLPLAAGLWGLGWLFHSEPGFHGLARSFGLLLGLIGLAGGLSPVTPWAGPSPSLPRRQCLSRAGSIRGSAILSTFRE